MALDKTTGTRRKPTKRRDQTDQSGNGRPTGELAYALKLTPRARVIRYGNETASQINEYERELKRPRKVAASERFVPPRPGERFTPPPGGSDFSVGDALLDLPGQILSKGVVTPAKLAGTVIGGVVKPVARDVGTIFHPTALMPTSTGRARSDMSLESMPGQRTLKDVALGPELYGALQGKRPTNKLGVAALGLEIAGVLPVARPLRLAPAVVAAATAAKGARTVREARRAAAAAYEATMQGPALTPQMVARGRNWAKLRNPPERVRAHEEIDNLMPDPIIRGRVKRQIDGEVYRAVKDLPTAERVTEAARRYEEFADAVAAAPKFPIEGFSYGADAETGAKRLQSFLRSEGKVEQGNAPMRSRGGDDISGIDPTDHQVIGRPTPQEWVERTKHSVDNDPELGLKLANWYRELGPFFRNFFGDDAEAIIRGFAVSQANASPAGGLLNVLRVRDKLLRGEEIKSDEISTVVKSIEAAYQGQHVSEGMQQKLTDFANSLQGKRTRTWTGDDIRGGKPTAIDIHAQRDLGWIDPKILDTLRYRHGLPVAHLQLEVMERELSRLEKGLVKGPPKTVKTPKKRTAWRKERRDEIEAQREKIETFKQTDQSAIEEGQAAGLVLDNPSSSASGGMYDAALRQYQEITDHLNEIKLWDKDDWEPFEVQALGWSAIQRLHGVVPEDAEFAIRRNTYEIAAGVVGGTRRMGAHLSQEEQMNVTRQVVDRILPALVEAENGFVQGVEYGISAVARTGDIAPEAVVKIVGTPEQVDRIIVRAQDIFEQFDVVGVRSDVTTNPVGAGVARAAHLIDSPAFSDPATTERFWTELQAIVPEKERRHFQSFSQITNDEGVPTLRVISNRGALSPKDRVAFEARFSKYVEQAKDAAGIPRMGYATTNVELRSAVAAAAAKGARRGEAGRVGDPLAAEARDLLHSAVEREAKPGVVRDLFRGLTPTEPGVRAGAVAAREGGPQEFGMFPPGTRPGEGTREMLYPSPKSITDPPSIPAEEREQLLNEWRQIGNKDTPLSPDEVARQDVLTRLLGLRHDVPPGAPMNTPPGTPPGGPPPPPRGVVGGTPDPDLPGGTPEAAQDFATARGIMRRGTQGSKGTYAREKRLQSLERRRRAGAAEYRMQTGEGEAAFKAAGEELRGQYPTLNFKGFKQLDSDGFEAVVEHVRTHPNLRTFEKYRAYKAIMKGLRGKVPTPSEVKLLERAFGKEVAANIKEAGKLNSKMGNIFWELWNLPRALTSSFDLSAPFRQGLMVSIRPRYQRLFWENFAQMHKMFGSQKVFDGFMGEIMESPNYGVYQQAKLAFTDLGDDLLKREEAFMSNVAERFVPGVKMSSRAYAGFLNKVRADMFDLIYDQARQQGVDVFDPHFLESLGRFINSSTGRGSGKMLEEHVKGLTAILWSPRLLWSRLNFLNPMYYYRLHPYVRKEALRSLTSSIAVLGGLLSLAAAGGADVEVDPRNANFAKIKLGDTRIDILGGFQQPVRVVAQMMSGKIISSTTGETIELSGGFGKSSPGSVFMRFLRSKMNPSLAAVADLAFKENFEGKPISYSGLAKGDIDDWKLMSDHFLPLLAWDTFQVMMEGNLTQPGTWRIDNPEAAGANIGLGLYGIGTQTYGAEGASGGGSLTPTGFNLGQRGGGFQLGGGGGGGGFSLGG